jgi:ribonuclease HIII
VNYVFQVTEKDQHILLDYYSDIMVEPGSEHVAYLFKSDDITVTLYKTGKVVLQGPSSRDDYLMFSEVLGFTPIKEPPLKEETQKSDRPYPEKRIKAIGSDEVGTGDFFGPVVVCATYLTPGDYAFLESEGVKDSKSLTDEQITSIASLIIPRISHQILVTDNHKYNDLIRLGYNMNKIKAYLHNHAILKLVSRHKGDVEKVIVDEFCSKNHYFAYLKDKQVYENIIFQTEAESKYLSVAAASIIARDAFLKEMAILSDKIGIRLPLGAGPAVDLIGKRIALEKGFSVFDQIAKCNFKNLEKIKAMM